MDRFGRRASLRYFRTTGPLPAKSFATLADDGTLELVTFPPSGGGDFQPRRRKQQILQFESRSSVAIFLLLVLIAFHFPHPDPIERCISVAGNVW